MTNKYLLISFLSILFLSSCSSRYYYAPTAHNVLTFKKKGDVSLSSGISSNSSLTKVGYSITNNIGLLSKWETYKKASYNRNSFIFDNEIIFYKEIEKNLFLGLNVGYGYGGIERQSYHYKLSIHRYFIQPSIGYSNDYFDIALSGRLSNANYVVKQKSSNFNINEDSDLKNLHQKSFSFTESAFTLGVGYKWIKLRYQRTNASIQKSKEMSYISDDMYLTLNLTFNIDNAIKKSKNTHKIDKISK